MKVWIYLGLVVFVVSSIGIGARAMYKAGWNARDVDVRSQIISAQEEARKREEERWAETVRKAYEVKATEEKIIENMRIIEKEIPIVVDRIVEIHPECGDLGSEFARLLNNQIRASTSRDGS